LQPLATAFFIAAVFFTALRSCGKRKCSRRNNSRDDNVNEKNYLPMFAKQGDAVFEQCKAIFEKAAFVFFHNNHLLYV